MLFEIYFYKNTLLIYKRAIKTLTKVRERRELKKKLPPKGEVFLRNKIYFKSLTRPSKASK